MYATATKMAKKLAEEEQIDELTGKGKLTYKPNKRKELKNRLISKKTDVDMAGKKAYSQLSDEPNRETLKAKLKTSDRLNNMIGRIDEQSIFEEIRQSLEERLTHAYENYDDAGFSDFVSSLTEEEIAILGLDEQYSTPRGGPVSAPKTAKDALRAADRGPRPVSHPHMGTGAQVRNVPGTSGSGMPGSGFQATRAPAPATAPAPAAKPATAPAPAARPVQRQAPRPAAKPAAPKRMVPRSKPPSRSSYGAGSAGDVGSSLSGTVASRMTEETKPQIKESFESFLRNKFLKD
jgi:hypothetical protein